MTSCALFTGGKDSTYAIQRSSHDIDTLLTIHAREGSMMYHVPAIKLSELASKAMDKNHVSVESTSEDELEAVKEGLEEIDPEVLITGAVESNYQKSRIDHVCRELGIKHESPLWGVDPVDTLWEVSKVFDIMVTAVAADGFDESWLGRKLDQESVNELIQLHRDRGVHPLGEGGEYESLVVNGPHMNGEINIDYEKEWDGVRGKIKVLDAELSH